MSELSIAAAQTVPVRGDVDANIAEHARLARAASAEGARLLLFPELSLTSYELDLAPGLAFSEDDSRLAPVVELAATHRLTLIVGAPMRTSGGLHIGAFIVAEDGSVDIYLKQHLGGQEPTVFTSGDRRPLLRLGDVTAAVAICADASHESHAQEAVNRGARAYLASTFITPEDMPRKMRTLPSYARRHRMTVLFSNYGGPAGGLESAGGSAVWSAEGVLLGQLERSGAGLVVTDAGARCAKVVEIDGTS